MNTDLYKSLLCQEDAGEIEYTQDGEARGFLVCKICNKTYDVIDGIVHMIDAEALPQALSDEQATRDKRAEHYDKRLAMRYHKEVISTMNALDLSVHDRVIEYACGTGRITQEIAKKSAAVLAIDFSLESLKVLQQKGLQGVLLVWGNATTIKTKKDFFDKAFSGQFYEHVPDLKLRNSFLNNVKDALKNDGVFISTIYHQDVRRILRRQPKEGKHKGNIFFHYYSKQEIQKEFGRYFDTLHTSYIDITLPLEARMKLSDKIGGWISRVSEKIPIVNRFGHLLLVKAKK